MLLKLDKIMYGAANAATLASALHTACPVDLISVTNNSGVATQVVQEAAIINTRAIIAITNALFLG
jgi:hypothetical protein